MQTITPFLWFDTQAKEAMDFYTSVFKNSKALSANKGPDGKYFSVEFELNGQKFMAMNAGPLFKFTEAISFFVSCDTQEEIDYYWEKLSEGGEKSQCGWLKDKFGLSWQIVPAKLSELLSNPDPEKSKKVMDTLLQMQKLDIAKLEEAGK